jgi:hypothetical protein
MELKAAFAGAALLVASGAIAQGPPPPPGGGATFAFSGSGPQVFNLSSGALGGMRALLKREDVRGTLQLNFGQKQKLDEMLGAPGKPVRLSFSAQAQGERPDPNAIREQIENQIKTQMGDEDKKFQEILKPEQYSRLKELVVQWYSVLGLRHAKNAKELEISDDTRKKIEEIAKPVIELRDKIMRSGTQEVRNASPDGTRVAVTARLDTTKLNNPNTPERQELDKAFKQAEQKAMEVLNAEETQRFKEATGTRFPFRPDQTGNWNRYFAI